MIKKKKTSGQLGIKGNFLYTIKTQATVRLSFDMVTVDIKTKCSAYYLLRTNKNL